MSSSPVQPYAVLDEVKYKLNIELTDTSQDDQITVATNDSNNYIYEQITVHSVTGTAAGTDPSLSSMANNLAASYFNFWISTDKDKEEIERWQDRIQQYIMAKFGKKSANMLSGEETFGFTSGFGGSGSGGEPSGDGSCECDGQNIGGGTGIFAQKSGDNLQFKSLVEGTNITISNDASTVTINSTASGTGDVVGPTGATDEAIARYDTTTGKLIQNSGVLINDSDDVTGVTSIAIGDGTWVLSEDGLDELLLTSPTGNGSHGMKVVSDSGEFLFQNNVSSNDYTALLKTDFTSTSVTTDIAFTIQTNITSTSDSGVEPLIQLVGTTEEGSVTNRPIFGFYNFSTKLWEIDEDGAVTMQDNLVLQETDLLYLDGGVDTYLQSAATDEASVIVGGTQGIKLQEVSSEVNTVIGKESALALSANNGFLHIPNMAGTPTGNPTGYTGKSPIVFDTAGDTLYVWDGSSWIEFESGSGGDAQTPWTSDIDADGFDLRDLSNLEFNGTTTGEPASSVAYITTVSGGAFVFNSPGGKQHTFEVGGSPEMRINGVGEINVFANQLINFNFLESNATTSSVGTIRLGNNEIIGWRNAANDGDLSIHFNASDNFAIEIAAVEEYEFNATQADFNGNNLVNLPGTFISALTTETPVSGDFVLISDTSDSGNLKKVDASEFLGGGGSQTPWLSNIDAAGFDLNNLGLTNLKIDDTTAILELEANHTTPTGGQVIGEINFIDDISTGARTTYAAITSQILNPLSLNDDGTLFLKTLVNGTLTTFVTVNPDISDQRIDFNRKLDMGNQNITEVNEISFGDTNATVAGSGADLLLDVPAVTDSILFRASNATEYEFTGTQANFDSNNLFFDGGNVIFTEQGSDPVTIAPNTGILYAKDVSTNTHPFWIDENDNVFDLTEGATSFPINFPEQAAATATATQDIAFDSTDRHAQKYTLEEDTEFTFSGTTTDTTEYIDLLLVQDSTGGWTIDLTTAGVINAAEVEAGLDLTALAETSILIKYHYGELYAYLQGGSAITSINADATSAQTLSEGNGIVITDDLSGDHEFAVDTAVVATFPIDFPESDEGDVTGNVDIDFEDADRHARKYRLTGNIDIDLLNPPTGEYAISDIIITQDGTGNRTVTFNDTVVNGTEVEDGINLGANEDTYIIIKWFDGIWYAFLQGSSGAGQTPWVSDVDADGFDLQDLSNIQFRDTTTAPANTIPSIFYTTALAPNSLVLNVPSGETIRLRVDGTTAFEFGGVEANFNNNNIVEIGTMNTHMVPSPGITSMYALHSDDLGEFAPTASADLPISDPQGSGQLVYDTSPTITTPILISPTISNFTSSNHDHEDTAGGGQLDSTLALSDTANIAYLDTLNNYTAGARQNFLGDTGGTAGLNVGQIAGNPTSQADGDIWYNSSSNTMFGRVNGVNVEFGESGITSINADTTAAQIIQGTTNQITVNSVSGTTTIDVGANVVLTDQANTWTTGLQNFAAADMRIPVSATPSVSVDGDIVFDSSVVDFTTGLIRFYGNEEQGIVTMPSAQFVSPTDGNVVAYNGTNDEFELIAQTGEGITSINGDTTAAQVIAGTTNQITVNSVSGTTTIDVGTNVVLTSQDNTYTAGTKQSFVADATDAGLNINAQLPGTLVAGDIYRTAEVMHFIGTSATDYILVSDGQPTTYTAGQKQSFIPDGTNAGINIGTAAVNPSAATNGDMYYNTAVGEPRIVRLGIWDDIVTATGTQTLTNKTLTTPVIGDFSNANHDHENSAGGSQLDSTLALSDTADIAYLNTANTWTAGLQSFEDVSLRIPVSATPTVSVDGDIAFDDTVTDFSTGLVRFYGNEEQALVSMPAGEFVTPTDGDVVTYNATNDEFELAAPTTVTTQTVLKTADQTFTDPASNVTVTDLSITLPNRTGGFAQMNLFLLFTTDVNNQTALFEVLDDGTPIAERLVSIGDLNETNASVTFPFTVPLDGSTITVTATTIGDDFDIQGGGTNDQNASYMTSFEVS